MNAVTHMKVHIYIYIYIYISADPLGVERVGDPQPTFLFPSTCSVLWIIYLSKTENQQIRS